MEEEFMTYHKQKCVHNFNEASIKSDERNLDGSRVCMVVMVVLRRREGI
jgi:hypothetical protein